MSGVQGNQAGGVDAQPDCKKCGQFYASAACNNLCSKCYRDEQVAKERAVTAVQASSAMISPSAAGSSEIFAKPSGLSLRDTIQLEAPSASTLQQEDIIEPAAETRQNLATSSSVQPPERPNKPTRCHFCRKKVGLTGFECRCGHTFCGAHRLKEQHVCEFDYKTFGREHLAASNPLVQAEKLARF